MPRLLVFALTVAITPLAASEARAQSLSPVSLDATLGMGKGWTGGEYLGNRSGVAADVMLGVRLRHLGGGALVAGLGASAQGAGASESACRPAADGGCVPSFPDFFTLAPLAGWESAGGVFRVLLGPAFVQASGEGGTLGVEGRLDLAVPIIRHLGAVASIRPTLIPDYRGDAVGLIAFGLGLRIR